MKNLLLSLCIMCSTISGFSQIYYKYQIVDAAEANKIYNATGGPAWTNHKNWPIPTGVTFGYKVPSGVSFAFGDTIILSYPPPAIDTGIVHLLIKELNLPYNNMSGALPAFSLDSLQLVDISDNAFST